MNRFYSFLFAAVLILAGGGAARAQNAAWARAFPNARVLFGQPRQMATDAAGHSYLTGFFTGTLVLGTDTLREADTSAPGRRADVFLAKYDAQGEVMWAKAIASPGGDTALAVAVDGSGNVLVAGSSAAGLTVGTTVLPNATCWLARFSGAGAPQWVTALFPSNAHEPMITALAADTAGNCYLAASSHDMQAVGTHALTHTSGGIALVARIDGAGMVSGVQEFAGRVRIYDLAVSGQGTLFCTGGAWNQVVFGPQPSHILTGPDSAVVFVAKISAALQTEWVRAGRAYPGRGISIGTTLTADAAGNCYLAGWCLGGMRLSVGVYTTKSGIFFAKYDDQGNVQWFREQEGSQSGFTYPSVMTTDGSGNVYTAGFYQNPGLRFGSYALSAGISAFGQPFLVSHDPAGNVRWARNGVPSVGGQFVPLQGLGTDSQGNLYLYGDQSEVHSPNPYNGRFTLRFDSEVIPGVGPFLVRFERGARVTGTVFLDANGNGMRDGGEAAYPQPVVVTETMRSLYCTSEPDSGRYHALLAPGPYSLTIADPPPYYTVSAPAGHVHAGMLTAVGQIAAGRDFGLAPVPNQQDLRVTLTSYTPARLAQPTRYRVRVENVGTTTVASGQVEVRLDTVLQIIGGMPAPTQQTAHTLTWDFQALAPFGAVEYELAGTIPINVALGTPMVSWATATPVSGDVTPASNVDTVRQEVIGSADPNDLAVNYTHLTPQQVAAGTVLDYLIRFQNVGSDTAFAVVIRDTLPAHLLQLSTMHLVGQSHNCEWELTGTGLLTLRFPGIRLPQRAVDVVRSMGYVRFQVVPRRSLTVGTVIPNQAHITFDFNAPLATNRVTTLIQQPNGLVAEPEGGGWSLYPNPATADRVMLTGQVPVAGRVVVQVVDGLGRPVQQHSFGCAAGPLAYALRLQTLARGCYALRLTLPDGSVTSRKLVVGW